MKYNIVFKMFGVAIEGFVKPEIKDKSTRKRIKKCYRQIVERAADIGANNKLLTSYALAAYFIAMNRETEYSAEENYRMLDKGMRKSKLLKSFMGNSKSYFSEKSMESRREWSKQTHLKKYKNDWVVDFLEKTDDYEFGFDYKECGVCKLCRDENCFELAGYLCKLDFMLVEIMGIKLERSMTLAEGCDKCDFRFKRK